MSEEEEDVETTAKEVRALEILVQHFNDNCHDQDGNEIEHSFSLKDDGRCYKVTIQRIDSESGIADLITPPQLITSK